MLTAAFDPVSAALHKQRPDLQEFVTREQLVPLVMASSVLASAFTFRSASWASKAFDFFFTKCCRSFLPTPPFIFDRFWLSPPRILLGSLVGQESKPDQGRMTIGFKSKSDDLNHSMNGGDIVFSIFTIGIDGTAPLRILLLPPCFIKMLC